MPKHPLFRSVEATESALGLLPSIALSSAQLGLIIPVELLRKSAGRGDEAGYGSPQDLFEFSELRQPRSCRQVVAVLSDPDSVDATFKDVAYLFPYALVRTWRCVFQSSAPALYARRTSAVETAYVRPFLLCGNRRIRTTIHNYTAGMGRIAPTILVVPNSYSCQRPFAVIIRLRIGRGHQHSVHSKFDRNRCGVWNSSRVRR
jgi:hypothetical protein